MPARFIVALDQGTTSSRTLIFDREASVRAVAQREFRQVLPRPGWVEHDPHEIWGSQSAVLVEALDRVGAGRDDVAAIGLTNQRETTLLWDRDSGEPLHNAIVWQDRRTAGLCDRLRRDGHEPAFRAATGLVIDPYFSGTKLAWLLDHVEGARARAESGELAFGTVDSWLIWRLTGGRLHVTDATNASRTLMWNIHDGDWDPALLDLLGVPPAVLPQVVDSSGVCGRVSGLGPLDGVPIAGILGDQQAALAGQLCFEPGSAKNTYGTGCFLLVNTGAQAPASEHGLLTTVAWRAGGRTTYAFEGSVFVGGAVVQWLRDGLGLIDDSADVQALARSVDDNGGVYLVPAFVGLGAPHWDPYARGAILGLTRGSTRGHFARAALESIAFQVADLLEAMEGDVGATIGELRVDGGAAVDDLLLQIQADVLQRPVVRPTVVETTALGAAYAAGLAVGVWPDVDALRDHWRVDRCFEPRLGAAEAEALRSRWREAVERSRGWERPE